MMRKTFCFLFLLVLFAIAFADESGASGGSDGSDSDDSGSKPGGKSTEDKKNKCEDLVVCDEPAGSATCTCDLTDGMQDCGDNQGSPALTTTEKTTWSTFITMIKTTILIDTTIKTAKKIVLINTKLQAFKVANAAIYAKLEFGVIKSYGKNKFVISDVDDISVSFMDETAAAASSFNGTTSSLQEAIKTAGTGDATFTADTASLIADITVILQSTTLKYEEQTAQIFDKIDAFVKAKPQHKDKLYQAEIKDFYTIEGFTKVAKKYKQGQTINTVISGSSTNNVLLKKIKEKYTDTSLTQDVRDKLQLFYNINDGDFSSETDNAMRLKKFAKNYYQFLKTNPELKKILDKIQLSTDFGSISDLVSVATYVNPEVDVSPAKLDPLIAGPWNATILVKAFYETFEDWGKTYQFQGLTWGSTQWITFRGAYINNNISLVLVDPNMSNAKKHKMIAEVVQIFSNGYMNGTFISCVPLEGFGFMSDYIKGNKISNPKQTKCPIPWSCVGGRHDLIKIKPDNTTDFTDAMEAFIAAQTVQATKTQIQTYHEQIKQVIYIDTTYKRKAHKVAQITIIVKTMKTAITGVNFDTVSFGKYGKLKKFCDCQDSAKAKDYK